MFAIKTWINNYAIAACPNHSLPLYSTSSEPHLIQPRHTHTPTPPHIHTVADLGGRGFGRFPFLRDSTPCRPKGSPLWTILRNPFWMTDLKIFRKAPLAPIYADFDGGARWKKTRFLVEIFQKVHKNPRFWPVFLKICLRCRNVSQSRLFIVFWESAENQFDRPKKGWKKISIFFFENPPPFEKFDPRLHTHTIYSLQIICPKF